jgi:hypothetical protein
MARVKEAAKVLAFILYGSPHWTKGKEGQVDCQAANGLRIYRLMIMKGGLLSFA